jgi:hypothetical protein
MMTYDELRIAGWDPAGGQVTAGPYMAATVRRSIDLLKAINRRYELYVWSDMFDPNENALPKYFMCNGPVTGALEGTWRKPRSAKNRSALAPPVEITTR